ncbi:MAG: diguanylate cyclase [Gallionella sp.]|nr:diguanylate cyclase [Gallionella sp.]
MVTPLEIPRELLAQAVDQSHEGITIADASQKDWPLIYVNAGFERLTGYPAAELLGKSVRLLQGTDTEQPEINVLREAMSQGKNCLVTLRNYRKDGSMFWNELSLSPVRNDAGILTHYIGIQHDVTARIMPDQRLRQTSLHTQPVHPEPQVGISGHFDEQLDRMLSTAQRTHSQLSVLVVNLDQFKHFNERYGRAAGDTCLRMVGERIARSFARTTDRVARHDGDAFFIVAMGESPEGLQQHVSKLRDQVRALNIPYSDSPDGVITICVGGVTLIPQHNITAKDLIKKADAALEEAKRRGHDCELLI